MADPIKECPEPLTSIRVSETQVTLLGTAHISQASADKVKALINSGDYDAVAIELCPSRHNAIVNPDTLAKMDLFQIVREGKAAMVAANLALSAYQQRMADQLGIEPGAEMRTAINSAADAKLPIVLIDREISVTLKRIYRNVGWWKRINLLAGLVTSVVSRREVSEEEIERLKEGDMLESAFTEFAEQSQELYIPLIDERDRYMSAQLQIEADKNSPKHILAIIGAGHMRGMQGYLQEANENTAQTIRQLDTLPAASPWPKIIPWLIAALILIGFSIGFSRNTELGLQLMLDWVLINGGLAALGALIATAHPLTVIGAFIAAPITSLNPAIGAGMVTTAIEIYLRKPNVEDFSNLRQDTSKLRGWWKNKVARTLLVFLFSTIGSAIGTYVAGFRILERLT